MCDKGGDNEANLTIISMLATQPRKLSHQDTRHTIDNEERIVFTSSHLHNSNTTETLLRGSVSLLRKLPLMELNKLFNIYANYFFNSFASEIEACFRYAKHRFYDIPRKF